jgi:Protein of unknown function (DUF2462)
VGQVQVRGGHKSPKFIFEIQHERPRRNLTRSNSSLFEPARQFPDMAQGAIKARPSKTRKPSHSSKHGITKKGARTVAPKKVNLVKQQKITKKFSAGLTAKTEKMLGEKVGHLEMLGGGKKGKGGKVKEEKGKGQKKKKS